MGLSDDNIFKPNEYKMTPEEEEKFNADFEAFCNTLVKNGRASMSDPYGKKHERPLSERLKDGSTIITDYVDCSGEIPFSEFYKKALNGDYNEK